ncbi:MAG: translation elongation factor Ts [Candidatus Sericytochromatia bacterium]|nr:translation elongation factor Ts [Candidatus Sericytochromatia bacterium]
MADISATLVKELRDKTGVGMMDCKKALVETSGDMEKSIEWLRQRGLSQAAKKADRATAEGSVGSYIHLGGKIGVLIEVNCETDFVARNDEFQQMVRDLAMHVAAANPQFVRREDVPAEFIEKEKAVLSGSDDLASKPEAMRAKIVEGRINKFYEQICFMEQAFIKDPNVTVGDFIKGKIAKLGENMGVARFTRYALGELSKNGQGE